MPLPRIQCILDNVGGQRSFAKLDMSKAYHHGYMDRASRHYNSFTSPWGLNECLRIPFGLSIATSVFQCIINEKFDFCESLDC